MKALILGMGNPILSDDGVGLAMAEMLKDRICGVDVAASAMIGLSLFDLITGYDVIFIVDAMTTRFAIQNSALPLSRTLKIRTIEKRRLDILSPCRDQAASRLASDYVGFMIDSGGPADTSALSRTR